MCARFSLKSSADVLQELFDLDEVPEVQPRYNIAPTQPVLAVVREGESRAMRWFHWGLIPSWAKDPEIGQRMINARGETILEKPSYRAAFKRRRCLIPADGFFEWVEVKPGEQATAIGSLFQSDASDLSDWSDSSLTPPKKTGPSQTPYKQPYFIHATNGLPLAIAGLHEYWETPTGGPIESCTIITTGPNDLMKPIHNRMPVLLQPDEFDPWLMADELEAPKLMALLDPYPSELMAMHPVTRQMSNPRFDAPECIAPLAT